MSAVFLGTPTQGHTSAGWPVKTCCYYHCTYNKSK